MATFESLLASLEEFNPEETVTVTGDEVEIANMDSVSQQIADATESEVAELDGFTEGTDALTEDLGALENTEAQLESDLENPNSEGLDQVSAEMLQRRLIKFQDKYKLSTVRLANAVSAENFSSDSINTRARSVESLEGLGDFLTSTWGKTTSIASVFWDKVTKVWTSLFTRLGLAKDVNNAMIASVNELINSPEYKSSRKEDLKDKHKVDKKLSSIFVGKGPLDPSTVTGFIKTQIQASKLIAKYVADQSTSIDAFDKVIKGEMSEDAVNTTIAKVLGVRGTGKGYVFGTAEKPLAGGFYGGVVIEHNDGGVSAVLEKHKSKDGDTDRDITSGDLKAVVTTLRENLALITETESMGKAFVNAGKAFKAAVKELEGLIKSSVKDGEETKDVAKARKKAVRAVAKGFTSISKVMGEVNSEVIRSNVKCINGVSRYAGLVMDFYNWDWEEKETSDVLKEAAANV